MDDISKLISNKKSQFILLSMERIKEEDKDYLNTLNYDELNKIKNNIEFIYNNIKESDTLIFNICETIIKNSDNHSN